MSRKRRFEYKVGPGQEEAIDLAKKVFKLQSDLGISLAQMSAESGLTRSTLSTIKSAWVNLKGKKHERMYPSIANGLVQFWNTHLNGQCSSATRPVQKQTVTSQAKPNNSNPVIDELVRRHGLAGTKALLDAQGKGNLLPLSTEQLASASDEELFKLLP